MFAQRIEQGGAGIELELAPLMNDHQRRRNGRKRGAGVRGPGPRPRRRRVPCEAERGAPCGSSRVNASVDRWLCHSDRALALRGFLVVSTLHACATPAPAMASAGVRDVGYQTDVNARPEEGRRKSVFRCSGECSARRCSSEHAAGGGC